MPAHRKLTPEQEAEAVALYESGLSLAQVGEKIGMIPTSIRAVLARNGVTFRPSGDQRHQDVPTARIEELRRKRYSWGQIGRILGMSPSAVSARYAKAQKAKGRP